MQRAAVVLWTGVRTFDPLFHCPPNSPKSSDFYSRFKPLIEEVQLGTIDGFFLSFDHLAGAPLQWPDGSSVRLYRSTRGFLLFRPEAFRKYGFETEANFACSVLDSTVQAQSPSDIVSLGAARHVQTDPWRLSLEWDGTNGACEIHCRNENEAELVRLFVRDRFKGRTKGSFRLVRVAAFRFLPVVNLTGLFRSWRNLDSVKRRLMLVLLLVVLICQILILLVTFGYLPVWFQYLVMGMVCTLLPRLLLSLRSPR